MLHLSEGTMTVESFRIRIPDDVLADLRSRLARTRFTTASDTEFWAAGTDPGYLRDLVGYWADAFDWRAAERALNAYPQYLGGPAAGGCISSACAATLPRGHRRRCR
jgi:hypothetical protein